MRRLLLILAVLAVAAALLAAIGLHNARAEPIVRRLTIHLPGWPQPAAPVRVVLLSDIHIGNMAMDVERLERIVDQTNRLSPDLILIAGDFVYGDDPVATAVFAKRLVAPLSRLHAPLGVVATFGNHDGPTAPGAIRAALAAAHIAVLENQAIRRGPLAIGGVGDNTTGHADIPRTMAALRRLPGARVIVTHGPDVALRLPADAPLLLAGHTHCGQAIVPFYGPVYIKVAPAYLCGVVRETGRVTVVTGGLGSSLAPLRYGAPPDLWLLTLQG